MNEKMIFDKSLVNFTKTALFVKLNINLFKNNYL